MADNLDINAKIVIATAESQRGILSLTKEMSRLGKVIEKDAHNLLDFDRIAKNTRLTLDTMAMGMKNGAFDAKTMQTQVDQLTEKAKALGYEAKNTSGKIAGM